MNGNQKKSYSRAPAVCERYGFSIPTLWRKSKEGTFPAPKKLSAGITAWRECDLIEWESDPLHYVSKS